MKKHYTFSNLPIAAVVLLVASLPCLAQARANESTSVLAVANNRTTLELSKHSRAVASSPVYSKNVESVKSPLSLSAASFKVSDKFSVDSKAFSGWQLRQELDAPDSKPQFNVDNYTPTPRRRVDFVPSRGDNHRNDITIWSPNL
jgi:hypothetical protein